VLSQKGGSGKTTLSLNLAIAAMGAGKQAVVIDLDPQQSAARWARVRHADAPVIISGHAPNLPRLLLHQAGSADLVIIDTAPVSESASLAAAKAADLILIPCQYQHPPASRNGTGVYHQRSNLIGADGHKL
jgi:chromosome partitioning protein